MTGRCSWCGRPEQELVERPTGDDRTAPAWWCRDDVTCQAARKAVRPAPRLRIAPR